MLPVLLIDPTPLLLLVVPHVRVDRSAMSNLSVRENFSCLNTAGRFLSPDLSQLGASGTRPAEDAPRLQTKWPGYVPHVSAYSN